MRLPASLPSQFVSAEVENLVGQFLRITAHRKYSLQELERIVICNPMVSSAVNARIYMTIGAMEQYTHPDQKIQEEVRKSIVGMEGTWIDKLAQIMGYIPYGFSITEKKYANFGGKAVLGGLRSLNQSWVSFEGEGKIEKVLYPKTRDRTSYGEIKYPGVIHLKNESHLLLDCTDPAGIAALERIAPLHEAYCLMLSALVIACDRQATPIMVYKTDIASMVPELDAMGRPVLDDNGRPVLISAGDAARAGLEELKNGSGVAIDRMDELMSIANQSDGKLLLQAIDLMLGMMSLAVLVPRSLQLTNAGGVGDATLADAQQKVFMQIIHFEVNKLSDALVDGLIRPMLEWNYGQLETYGHFPVRQDRAFDAAQQITAVTNAISGGAIQQNSDVIGQLEEFIMKQLK